MQSFTLQVATGGPFVYSDDLVVAEGSNGTVIATFTVTLGAPNTDTVSVDFATADGTALAGQDYVGVNGTLTYAAGQTEKFVQVTITADGPPEPQEEFYLRLSNPVNTIIADDSGTCLITEVMITGISVDALVSFNAIVGHHYTVERSDDMVNWTSVDGGQNILATGQIMTVTDRGAGCQPLRLYRARLLD